MDLLIFHNIGITWYYFWNLNFCENGWFSRKGDVTMYILEVRNLKKSFGSIQAVKDISFSVQEGEIFTIIGPNGAGKTTTLEMIARNHH